MAEQQQPQQSQPHSLESKLSAKVVPTSMTPPFKPMRPSITFPSSSEDITSRDSIDEPKLLPEEVLVIKDGTIKLANPRKDPEPQYDVNGELIKASGTWTQEEHERFLKAIANYPKGPWKAIAAMVGSRTVRQTQTHAQKYREKIARRLRGLRNRNGTLQTPPMRMQQLVPTPMYSQVLVPSNEYCQAGMQGLAPEFIPMQPLTSVLTDEQGVPISWENCVGTPVNAMYATASPQSAAGLTFQDGPSNGYAAVSPAMGAPQQYAYQTEMVPMHASYYSSPMMLDAAAGVESGSAAIASIV